MTTLLNLLVCATLMLGPSDRSEKGASFTIVPHTAAGSFDGGATSYTTVVQVTNQTTGDQVVTAEFFGQDGSVSTLPFNTTDPTVPSFTGTFGPVTLPSNGTVVITSSSSVTTGTVNWARVVTDTPIVILTVFEIRDIIGNLISRVGVPGSASGLENAVIPRLRDVAKGIQTAFAVVNTDTRDVMVTATLYSDSAQGEVFVGNLPDLPRRSAEPIAQAMFPLAGLNQTAQFFNQLFAPLNDPDGTNYNHVVFKSTAPTLGATALVFEGTNQATWFAGF